MTVTASRFPKYVSVGTAGREDTEHSDVWHMPEPIEEHGGGFADESLEATFQSLLERWRRETRYQSSSTTICTHKAYQRIIGLGKPVLPLILREMEQRPGQWFWALRAITGEEPEPEAMAGDVVGLSRVWIEWGRDNGIL